jgi:chitin disaccharide deacetylase
VSAATPPPALIVNADDYGYFRCVSAGILRAATEGIVTATGVFANRPDLEVDAARLRDHAAIDVGVHLNLTDGTPLTGQLRSELGQWSGRFPGKYALAVAVLTGRISPEDVAREWRAQIERCLACGLKPVFLNSHEHVHMLPPLFPIATALARECGVAHIRFPTAERAARASAGGVFRNAAMKTLGVFNRSPAGLPAARFLGLQPSGRLDLGYLEDTIPRLRAGEVYELMCHPGQLDRGEVDDPRLLGYHDWEGELALLTSPAAKDLLQRHGVRLVGYRHLEILENRLVIRRETA